MANRVVITGMGIWSCIGTSLDEVRDALYQGKSGIIFSQERKDAGFRSALVGNVPKVDIKAYVPRSLRNFMPEEAQYGYIATKQALENAVFLHLHTVIVRVILQILKEFICWISLRLFLEQQKTALCLVL